MAAVEALEGRTLFASTTFTVDPAQSTVAISGNVAGVPFQEQSAGSLSTNYAGVILADVTSGAITFSSGSNVDALAGGSYAPGGTPADYGLAVPAVGDATIAVRDLALGLTSAAVPIGGGGAFASSAVTLTFASGTVDVASLFGNGLASVAGNAAPNGAASPSTLQQSGSVLTLTIPIAGTFNITQNVPAPVQLTLTGQIVATGEVAVEEPPELTVLAGSSAVTSGQSLDFGSVAQGATAVRTLWVRNDGGGTLTLGAVAAPAGFTVVQALPASLAAGATASLQLALDTASAGARAGALTISSNDADEATFTVNLAGTVNAAPPATAGVALTGVTVSGVPSRVVGGDRKSRAVVAVQLVNQNAAAFSGPLTITLLASEDAFPSPGTDVAITQVSKNLKFKPQASGKPLKLKVQLPAVPADGEFFLVAAVSGAGVNAAQASAASAATVRIERPVVDLVDADPTPDQRTLDVGTTETLSLALRNDGNVAAKGTVNFELFVSADQTLANAIPFATRAVKVSLNPGFSKFIKLKILVLPPGGVPLPPRAFLLIRLNAAGSLADLNVSDGELLNPITVRFDLDD